MPTMLMTPTTLSTTRSARSRLSVVISALLAASVGGNDLTGCSDVVHVTDGCPLARHLCRGARSRELRGKSPNRANDRRGTPLAPIAGRPRADAVVRPPGTMTPLVRASFFFHRGGHHAATVGAGGRAGGRARGLRRRGRPPPVHPARRRRPGDGGASLG